MKPLGYMAKFIVACPPWLHTSQVKTVCSVSACVSSDFTEWIECWRHNGYWLFDSLDVIDDIVREKQIDATSLTYFYYEGDEREYDDAPNWVRYEPEPDVPVNVEIPVKKVLIGFDIVSYTTSYSAECSPLSCNHLAEKVQVNEYCLLETAEAASTLITSGALTGCEPGPYRIIAVYRVER